MAAWLVRWSSVLVAVAAVLAGILLLARIRRGPARASAEERPPAPAPPPGAAARPRVLAGDHSQTPLFPALDTGERLWGYIDASGAFVIAPQYTSAEPFSEGLAFVVVAADGRLACIDKNARERFTLVNPSPTGWLAPEGGFREGFALVVLQGSGSGNRYTYVDTKGALLGPPRFWPAHAFSGGLAAVAENGRWGFLGADGKPAIPLGYREVFDFTEGLAAVVRKRRMGYIDARGHDVIPARYELALEFGDGLAPVQPGSPERGDSSEMGYIDRTGRLVIPPQFANAQPFSEGRARVLLDARGKWGFIDTHGKLVVPASYDEASDFSDGIAAVRAGTRWGYVDREGQLIIPPTFEVAGDFVSGLARVRLRGGDGPSPRAVIREGYVDRAGRWVYAWEMPDLPVDRIPAPPVGPEPSPSPATPVRPAGH